MTASYLGNVHSHTCMHFAGIFIQSDSGFKGDCRKLSHLYSTEYLYSSYYWDMFSQCNLPLIMQPNRLLNSSYTVMKQNEKKGMYRKYKEYQTNFS